MKICFCSNASPWFFGPYGKQLKYLCEYFLKNNNYNVYYILLGNYTLPNNDSKIKYISNIKSINYMYLISDINLSRFNHPPITSAFSKVKRAFLVISICIERN